MPEESERKTGGPMLLSPVETVTHQGETSNRTVMDYPLLQELLALRGLKLKPGYTNGDLAEIFGVTIRAIQARMKNGDLTPHTGLPGGIRLWPSELEDYLRNSRKGR
jgi:hypothetical protein